MDKGWNDPPRSVFVPGSTPSTTDKRPLLTRRVFHDVNSSHVAGATQWSSMPPSSMSSAPAWSGTLVDCSLPSLPPVGLIHQDASDSLSTNGASRHLEYCRHVFLSRLNIWSSVSGKEAERVHYIENIKAAVAALNELWLNRKLSEFVTETVISMAQAMEHEDWHAARCRQQLLAPCQTDEVPVQEKKDLQLSGRTLKWIYSLMETQSRFPVGLVASASCWIELIFLPAAAGAAWICVPPRPASSYRSELLFTRLLA